MKYPFNFCPKFFTINKFSTKYLLIFNGHLCTARTYLEKETNNLSMGITVISCMFNMTQSSQDIVVELLGVFI